MPNRILRPEINSSHRVDALGDQAELFYRRLMSVVDDFGRYSADLALLRAACYPLRTDKVSLVDIRNWLESSVSAGLIKVYTSDGKQYLEYLNLGSPRAKGSKFPEPASTCAQTHASVTSSDSGSDSGTNSSSGSSACSAAPVGARKRTTPTLQPLTSKEWEQPDPQQIARGLASSLTAEHWCASEIPHAEAAIWREIATVVDPLAWETAVRVKHKQWRDGVDRARLDGCLPNSIANKRLAYWFSDRMYLQEPRFAESQQSRPKSKLGASVERLLGGDRRE